MATTVRQQALTTARDLREEVRERGAVFTQDEYRGELAARLAASGFEGFELWLDELARIVDEEAACISDKGAMFDLAGEYRLADGRRVAKRYSLREHGKEALAM